MVLYPQELRVGKYTLPLEYGQTVIGDIYKQSSGRHVWGNQGQLCGEKGISFELRLEGIFRKRGILRRRVFAKTQEDGIGIYTRFRITTD